jgi:hypothetical protein
MKKKKQRFGCVIEGKCSNCGSCFYTIFNEIDKEKALKCLRGEKVNDVAE